MLKFNVKVCFYVLKIGFNVPVYEFSLWSRFNKNVKVQVLRFKFMYNV
jgi:hypothetical protein